MLTYLYCSNICCNLHFFDCVQVEGGNSVIYVFKELIREEGILGISKGLSARIAAMIPSSFLITLGYETIKKLSLRSELVESGEFRKR